MNYSQAEQFAELYRAVGRAFRPPSDPELSHPERTVLEELAAEDQAPLSRIAGHLALPKSTASVVVKRLERRGFLRRARDPADERRLAIALTHKGRRRVASETVLDVRALAASLAALPRSARTALFDGLERLLAAGRSRPR